MDFCFIQMTKGSAIFAEMEALILSKIKNSISKIRFLIFFGVIFLGGILVWQNGSIEEKLLTEKKLLSLTTPGEVTPLKKIVQFDQKYVYTLGPYQDFVSNECPQADRINQHLRAVNYVADEGHWSLVFADEDKVIIITFKRKPDFLGVHELKEQYRQEMPTNFKPSNWAEMDQAALYRLSIEDRQYLVFGRGY